MENEPKSIWKRPWKGPRAFVFWILIVSIAAFLGAVLIAATTAISTPMFDRHPGFENFVGCVLAIMFGLIIAITALFVLVSFVRWALYGPNLKIFLFGCACFATLIAVFYAEEDWRGKYDWNKFKREWEAKGENFEPKSVLPPPVPDDENFAMSPVWIAEEKSRFESEPKRAEAWYGDRIYSEEVSNYYRLLPVTVSALAGTNWAWGGKPNTPEISGKWATAQLTDLAPWQSYYRNVQKADPAADIPIAPKPQTPAQDVLLALSIYDPLIEQLRRDSQLPYSRFPIGYDDEDPAAILLPHLAAIKQCAQVLELRAIAELQNGQTDDALKDINLMLRLADASRVEPFVISQLVRIAVLEIALQPIYEGLARHQWSDSQLAELESGLSKIDFVDAYWFSLHGEMVFSQPGVLDYLRHHPAAISSFPAEVQSGSSFWAGILAGAIPGGWFYQNELNSARAMEEYYLPIADRDHGVVSPTAVRRADAAIQDQTRHLNAFNILERLMLPAESKLSITFAYGQNSLNLARVAIALERYRIAHGEYPDSLDAVAQFINPVPHDVINGGLLHYRRTEDGQFILYSIGWNETDDGGVVVMKKGSTPGVDREQGDWVWRYPEK